MSTFFSQLGGELQSIFASIGQLLNSLLSS
jgi:hypothetical protein